MSESRPRRRRLLIAGLVVGAASLVGVGWFLRIAQSTAPRQVSSQRDAPYLDGKLIRFSAAFAKRANLAAETVVARDLVPLISVTGTVTYDGRKFAAVGARIAGRVRRVFKIVGDAVRPNEVLAEIESAELGRAEAQVLAARAKELAAEAHMKRERQLASARITSERDAEVAKADHEVARAGRIAAERAVQALGGRSTDEVGILLLRSPIAGRVVAAKVSRGKTVDPTDTVYEVADLSTVWVELAVFERDLPALRVGDRVEITSQIDPSQHQDGKVDHVGYVIDVKTRSAPVRVVVDDRGERFRPGQSVHARIHTAARTGKVLGIPRVAITRIDGKATVFVLVGQGAVEPRAVTLGPEDARTVAVVAGVRAGERVVTGGVFELKSELFR